jgi:citrate lyase gamma subunit
MAALRESSELILMIEKLNKVSGDIGTSVGKQYGTEVGKKITSMMDEHVSIVLEVVNNLKSKDEAKKNVNVVRLYSNADQLGKYFDDLKGIHIFRHHMKMHIDTLINSIISFINNDAANDIKFTDAYISAGIKMAFDLCHY